MVSISPSCTVRSSSATTRCRTRTRSPWTSRSPTSTTRKALKHPWPTTRFRWTRMLWYHLFNLEFIANTTAGGGRGSPPSALAVAGGTPDRSETTGVRMRTAASLLSGAILLLAITLLPLPPAAYAQDETAIGVDAITEGNTATSLGPHDSCVSVDKG